MAEGADGGAAGGSCLVEELEELGLLRVTRTLLTRIPCKCAFTKLGGLV